MEYRQPFCYKCPNFEGEPTSIGGKAKCKAYTSGVPKAIFYEGKMCPRRPKSTLPKFKSSKTKQRKKVIKNGKR